MAVATTALVIASLVALEFLGRIHLHLPPLWQD
jgi:hypothetical protein